MKLNQQSTLSFILRIWQADSIDGLEGVENNPVWRASLDDPQTGNRAGFRDLESLFSFIRDATKRISSQEADNNR